MSAQKKSSEQYKLTGVSIPMSTYLDAVKHMQATTLRSNFSAWVSDRLAEDNAKRSRKRK